MLAWNESLCRSDVVVFASGDGHEHPPFDGRSRQTDSSDIDLFRGIAQAVSDVASLEPSDPVLGHERGQFGEPYRRSVPTDLMGSQRVERFPASVGGFRRP